MPQILPIALWQVKAGNIQDYFKYVLKTWDIYW